MKKLIFMILAIILVASLTTKTIKAQTAKASTTAGAEIVGAISITSDASLNFGKMSAPSADVDVTISTAKQVTSTNSSVISLFSTNAANAHYNVSGASGFLYNITLPADDLVLIQSGSNSMHVNGFKARTTSISGSDGTSGTLVSGADTFVVGATLKVKSGQLVGTYSGTFDVIVAYN
jgi:spore coat protein U-like protein